MPSFIVPSTKMHRSFPLVIFVSILCCAGFIYAQEKYGCKKNECAKYTCTDHDKCNGRLIKNGSLLQCGCCDVCVKHLDLGEPCQIITHSSLPREECGDGLKCVNSKDPTKPTCDHANTKCIQAKIKFQQEKALTQGYTMGRPEPECDTFGDYKPVQCKEGMKCYCVDLDGNRIFGIAPYAEKTDMNCSCSREYETFKRHMMNPDEPNQFMRCEADGDYYHTQCTDDKCYCVDPSGVLTKIPIPEEDFTKLMCSDEYLPYFNTTCTTKYNDTKNEIAEFRGPVIGIELPSCDLDGSYSPVQCRGFECYCVNKQGHKLGEGIIARNSEAARSMTCGCLREKNLLEGGEKSLIRDILTQYKCDTNGNYLAVQCTIAVCFCVDEIEGFQNSPPNLVSDRRDLPCYDPEYAREIEEILKITFD